MAKKTYPYGTTQKEYEALERLIKSAEEKVKFWRELASMGFEDLDEEDDQDTRKKDKK